MEAVNTRATALYVPPAYTGRVVVYQSGGLRTHGEENRPLAWESLIEADLEVVDIPGSKHDSLFNEPYIGSVAQHLKDSIQRAVDAAGIADPR